jgi:multiple sugar transport system substrate-binding protein
MKSKNLQPPVKATKYDGKTWAVPWFTDAGMFYYRKDLQEKSGFSEPPRPGTR